MSDANCSVKLGGVFRTAAAGTPAPGVLRLHSDNVDFALSYLWIYKPGP